MACTGILFTITEWPLTEVATLFDLMLFSLKILVMALETLPLSTIIESTTMSEASGSRPTCTTSTSPRLFFNSTALMLLEPMSRPTIDFDPPIPNINIASVPSRRGSCGPGFLLASAFPHTALTLHPRIQDRLLELPAVGQLDGRNLLFVDVLVQRVRTHAQVWCGLANVHHLTRICHTYL